MLSSGTLRLVRGAFVRAKVAGFRELARNRTGVGLERPGQAVRARVRALSGRVLPRWADLLLGSGRPGNKASRAG